MPLFGIALGSRFSFGGLPGDKVDEAEEVDESFETSDMSMESFPTLPVYRSKGVWIDGDEDPRYHAITWAYNHWSSATDHARRFMVNAVAAVFDFQLIQHCSKECANGEPCAKCGHWKWVTDPLPPDQKYWMGGTRSILPFGEDSMDEKLQYFNHPQSKWNSGPGSLITKEAIRCAASMIIATKADFWCSGPIDKDLAEEEHDVDMMIGMKKKVLLGEHATSMLLDLYPDWNVEDATEPVLAAGVWANTCNILQMMDDTPLPDCVPLWGMKEKSYKLNLGPEMRNAFSSYPAGTEGLLDFINVAKKLLRSPLVLYFPSAMDLGMLVKADTSVNENPFHYHMSSELLGVDPMNEYDIYSVFGRLASFNLAETHDNQKVGPKIWNEEKMKESVDYSPQFDEICKAYFAIGKSNTESAFILFKARPVLTQQQLNQLLEVYGMEMSGDQLDILNLSLQ